MRLSLRPILLLVTSLSILMLLSGGIVLALGSAELPTPEDAIAEAWERARAQSSYHVVADIEQTLTPIAVSTNLGRGDKTVAIRVLGDVAQQTALDGSDEQRARMQFYAGRDEAPVEMLLSGSEAFVGYKNRWQRVEDPLGGVAPGGDYLGYLVAVKDVAATGSVNTAEGNFKRYTFSLDGPLYAEYQRQRTQDMLMGQIPPGVQLKSHPVLQAMSGQGELWVDADGLPRRQILDIDMPGVSAEQDEQAHMIVDFSRFSDYVPAIEMPQPEGESGAWVLPKPSSLNPAQNAQSSVFVRLEPLAKSLRMLVPTLIPGLIVLPFLIFAILLVRRRRTLYLSVVLALVVVMVTQPLLQAGQFANFADSTSAASSFSQALGDLGVLSQTNASTGDTAQQNLADLVQSQNDDTTTLRDCRSLYVDAGILPGDDNDGDGLTNEIEWCLGTDYDNVDSDSDTITDTLEVKGFTYDGQTWFSNPMLEDSNWDGMSDNNEWNPNVTDDGFTDYDGDGLPNLWDEDNDGDGVPDNQDISPFQVMPYRSSFDVQVSSHSANTTVYVDVQMQPEETSHLRYSLTSLDWPTDNQGQIMDLDNSTEDIALIPILDITSTISPTLSREYGIASQQIDATDPNSGYSLWAPLLPVSEGGNIYALSTRIPFSSEEADQGISLTNGRILWLTQATLDSCKAGDKDACQDIETDDSVIASYYDDPFRLTGLNISESKDVKVGLLGTNAPQTSVDPAVDDEDKVMLTLMAAGLAGSFLFYVNPDLDQIVSNFEDAAALSPFTYTWGIDPSLMSVTASTFDHQDEALATTTQTNTVAFLDDNFIDCTINTTAQYTPTLAMAYEESSAFMDITDPHMIITNDDADVQTSAPVQFQAPLGDAPIMVIRHAQLNSYACVQDNEGSASWEALSIGQALAEVDRRYADDVGESYMGMVQNLFTVYDSGQSNIISLNGVLINDVADTASSDAFNRYIDDETTTMPDYVRKVYDLDSLLLSIDSYGTMQGLRDWTQRLGVDTETLSSIERLTTSMFKIMLTAMYAYGYTQITAPTVIVSFIDLGLDPQQAFLKALDQGYTRTIIDEFYDGNKTAFFNDVNPSQPGGAMAEAYDQGYLLKTTTDESAAEAARASWSETTQTLSTAVSVVLWLAVEATIWISYGVSNNGLSSIQKDYALAEALSISLLLSLQILLDMIIMKIATTFANTGVGLVVELIVFILLYIIVSAITGDWNPFDTYNHLTKWLAKAILKVDVLAKVPEDGGVNTSPLNMTLDPGSNTSSGPLPGTWFQISTTISTTVKGNSVSGVDNSWAFARWEQLDEQPFYLQSYRVNNSPIKYGKGSADGLSNCDSTSGTSTEKECSTDTVLQFQTSEAGRNTAIPFVSSLESYLRVKKCWFFKTSTTCSKDTIYSYGPDKNVDTDLYQKALGNFYIDILPGSLDTLVTWDVKNPVSNTTFADFNLDQDNDELSTSQENTLGTEASNWDTDGDGLSDGWEYKNLDNSGANPTVYDTDGDGLDDLYEVTIGTSVTISDTDGDGLLDGEEPCHINSGRLVGGWKVTQAGNYHVCSDPLKGDYDGDGLLDSQERRAGLSPYAPNTAPRLQVVTVPGEIYNRGWLSVLKAGDPLTVSLSLYNTTAANIDQSLYLDYATDALIDMTTVSLTGSDGYTPPNSETTNTGLSWDLTGDPLYALESMTATLLTSVDSGVTESKVTSLQARVTYSDVVASEYKVISQTVPVLIDEDEPNSTVIEPADGDAINGTAYTLGGSADDPTSWPVAVDVRVSGDSYDTGWQEANGASSWAWTWSDLPGDGLYTVQSQATDYVGNVETAGSGISVIVDNTAPGADFSNLADGEALTLISDNQVTVQGEATDLLSGVSDVAGLQVIQLSINGRPWVNVAEYLSDPHPDTAAWLHDWSVNDDAYGSHSLAVRAVDALGNIGNPTEIEVIIDTLPPTDMWSNYQADLVAGQSFELLGHADDVGNVPLPARPHVLENFMDPVISATVLLMPESYTDTQGMTVAWLGDIDGDARADLAVGMPAAKVNGQAAAGRVSIIYGAPGGWPIPSDAVALADASTSFIGSSTNTLLGRYLSPARDVNADGLSDFLIGDTFNDQVYLVYGQTGPMGSDFNPASLSRSNNATKGKVFSAGEGQAGQWIAPAGDVDGDGYHDLLIGVTGLSSGTGEMYLVKGRSSLSAAGLQDLSSSDVSLEYFQMDDNGAVATGVGDVNDDQYDDFVIADPNDSLGAGQAAVYLFLGPPTWRLPGYSGPLNPLERANASFLGDSGAAVGAEVVALGDVNGDHLPDFAFSSDNTPRIVYGRTDGWAMGMSADVSFDGYSPAPNAFIAAPGDVDVDGLNDILLGAKGGGERAYLVLGSADLAGNQPVQATFSGVSAAASAPYTAGADLNCDNSSDLLLIPTGDYTNLDAESGQVRMRRQELDLGPAPRPRALRELPASGAHRSGSTLEAQALSEDESLTNAIAFKIYENNIDDWNTDAMLVGDWDGDSLSDVSGWTGSAWHTWHADGVSGDLLGFSEYSNNMPSAVTGNAARLQGDFDGDGLDDLAVWDSANTTWQFVRSNGLSGSAFDFVAVDSYLGSLDGGDPTQILVGDFDGDGKSDVLGWKGAGWDARISQATETAFDFTSTANNLDTLAPDVASALFVGDFNGDGKNDVASRDSDTSNWVIWQSQGVIADTLTFQEITDTSLGYAIDSSVSHLAADFSGDGKTDVLALMGSDFYVSLSQASAASDAVPFRQVPANALQFSGNFPDNTLSGDFDGDGKADYASLDKSGTGWVFQLASLARTRYVDDDYCQTCSNDSFTWGLDAFATIQHALDAAWYADTLIVQPGVYSDATLHAGQDYLTLQGVDPDAVFLDAGGGVGITVLPIEEISSTYPNIEGVAIQNLTIHNASTGIEINYGGQADDSPGIDDDRNIQIKNVLIYQDQPGSTAIQTLESALWIQHATLVSNASDVTLVHSKPGSLTDNYIYLQNNLFVALPNAAPLPFWWSDDSSQDPRLNSHNGFVSANAAGSDWSSTPSGTPMIVEDADFLNVSDEIFRIGADSVARGQASDGKDMGYYSYHEPVYVDATYCQSCDNDGRTWGDDAYDNIQDAIDSGAQKVLIEPGLYRERVSLVNGVSLFGSGAGLTVLAPPDEEIDALVSIENAKQTTLALVTVTGEDNSNGITLSGDSSFELERAIVRNTGSALSVNGSDATATLVNNTLVSNDYGVVGSDCANLNVRNSIFAFHQDTALAYNSDGCPSTQTLLHTFNAYWRNGSDLSIDGIAVDDPRSGEIFANPRFINPDQHDYRPRSDSPVVDTGDPSDPAPPGSGLKVDMGYAQSAEAAVYASRNYCEQCLNDGLEWQVTAFDTIQDAIDNVPDIDGIWTVGVDSGDTGTMVYEENVQLKSGIRLIGGGAETTLVDGGDSGSVLSLDGVTNVEITGFTLTDGGANSTDAGILVAGASNNITITYNIIGGDSPESSYPGNGNAGVIFQSDATGFLYFNTIAVNSSAGVVVEGDNTWLDARYNIIALNDIGFDNSGGGQIFNEYNLVYNTDGDWCATCQDYVGSVTAGQGEINNAPLFIDANSGDFRLTTSSPAVDGIPADQWQPVQTGGGTKADMGYRELLATPATLLLGKEGDSCGLGNAGITSVDVGLVYISDASQSITNTLPSGWQAATLSTVGESGSYWTASITPDSGDGLYRLYSKATDGVGNISDDAYNWFRSEFIADGTAPSVTLVSPDDGATYTAPAITLKADVSDWVPTGLPGDSSYNIADVHFEVDGVVITATQTITTVSSNDNRRYESQLALADGTHTVRAYATDLAGNVGQSGEFQITMVTTQNEAALTSPLPGSAVLSATLSMQGFVHFQDTEGEGQVEILIDGNSQGLATLADASAQATSWSRSVSLSGDGSHTLTLQASRSSGSSSSTDSTTTLVLDTVAPAISFQATQEVVTNTLTLSGSASDATSGLASISVSVDGGYTYDSADVDENGNWSFTWSPAGNDYTSFPLRIQAVDVAGNNAVQSATAIVDNQGPTAIDLLSAAPQEGSHLDAPSAVELSWVQPSDGSGVADILLALDQYTDTVPSGDQTVTGNSYSAELTDAGAWYIHLSTVDSTGNQNVEHFGPWYAETGNLATPGPLPPNPWRSSVRVNGNLDIAHGEWDPETELLGLDPMPARPQALYTTWDADYLYLAWLGAVWGPHGTGTIYLDTQPGGSATALADPKQSLPLQADFAVVSGFQDNKLLRFVSGDLWEEVQDIDFLAVHGGNGDTEIRLSRSVIAASGAVQLFAFVQKNNGDVQSVFPTANPSAGPWTVSYIWSELAQGVAPNEGQPGAHHLQVRVSSPDIGGRVPGPGSSIRYVFKVSNQDKEPEEGATLIVSGSEGLQFESLTDWPTAQAQPQADRWFIDLGIMSPGTREPLTITARVVEGLANTDSVTITAQIEALVAPGEPAFSFHTLSHAVDSSLPTLSISLPDSGATLRSGPQTIRGWAGDLGGGGVAKVEVQMDGGAWISAQGAKGWSATIDVPAEGEFTLSARAIDNYGYTSEVDSVQVTVDNEAPVALLNPVEPVLGGRQVRLSGQAFDSFPADGSIERVEIQVDGGPWWPASHYAHMAEDGVVPWSRIWRLPALQGSQHSLRVRAVDVAGNTGQPSEPAIVTIDSIPPASTIAYPQPGGAYGGHQILVWGLASDGWGLEQVEVSLDGGRTWSTAMLADQARSLLENQNVADVLTHGQLPEGATIWATLLESDANKLVIRSRATDLAGNVETLRTPVRVTQSAQFIYIPLVTQ
ncbi:MAG: hypothetical protein GY759_16655 [Chloroflexi bacterium]|nr:hypothetical protein [Chloroflexota bacterium]